MDQEHRSCQFDKWHPLLWHINVLISLDLFWEFYYKNDIRKFRALNDQFRSDKKLKETHINRVIKDILKKWRHRSVRCQMSDTDAKIMKQIKIAKNYREQYFRENQPDIGRSNSELSELELFNGTRYPQPYGNYINYNTEYYISRFSDLMLPQNRDSAIDSIYIHTCLRDVNGSIEIKCCDYTIFKIQIKNIFSGLSDEFIKATDYIKVPFLTGGVYICSLELGFSSIYLYINLYNDTHLTILQNAHVNFIKVTYVHINVPIYNLYPIRFNTRHIKMYMGNMVNSFMIKDPLLTSMAIYHPFNNYNIIHIWGGMAQLKYI